MKHERENPVSNKVALDPLPDPTSPSGPEPTKPKKKTKKGGKTVAAPPPPPRKEVQEEEDE